MSKFLKFCILNSLMPLIMCAKFQINRIILTLFSGVWDKNPRPVAEKVVNAVGNKVKVIENTTNISSELNSMEAELEQNKS